MSQITHRMTQATTQPTQLATQRTDAPATNVSNPPTNRRTGRQQGSQGYSGNDCLALVNFVKHVRPLGSNDWEHVNELYNQYALEAGRSPRDADPLKTKFRAMVASKKPTGDPDCPVWIREAKRANMMIKDRAHSIAFVDEEDEEIGSEDERNGVGNPIPLSPGNPGYTEGASQTQTSLLTGWSATQSHPPENHEDTNDDSLAEFADLSQSSAHVSTRVNPAASAPTATILRPSPIVTQGPNNPHAALATSSARSTNTAAGTTVMPATQGSAAGRRGKAVQPQAALHTTIASFFNPEARAARDQETSMSHFYAARLQEANSTISRLQDEANRLREGVNIQVLRLQEEVQQARLDLAAKTTENQDLRHRIEMLQLRMEMQQPHGFGMQGMMQAPMFLQSNAHQNPSTWEVNTNGSGIH